MLLGIAHKTAPQISVFFTSPHYFSTLSHQPSTVLGTKNLINELLWKFLMCKIGSHPTSATDLPFGVCNLNRSALYAERIFSSSGRWWLTFRSELREFIWKGWRNNQMTASKNKIEENNPDKNNKAVTVDPPSWEK